MTDQPLPTPGGQSVTRAVMADLAAREARGVATYGRSLETFNGRDAVRDLYEELLDASQYCRQWLMEREAILATLAARDARIAALEGLLREYTTAHDEFTRYGGSIYGPHADRILSAERALWAEAEQLEARDGE